MARVAGRYGDGKREVTIEMVDGRLILRGTLWFSNALLPVTPNVFDVESWPLRVIFDGDSAGSVRALHFSGLRSIVVRFARICPAKLALYFARRQASFADELARSAVRAVSNAIFIC